MKKIKLTISIFSLLGFLALNSSISSSGKVSDNLSLENLKALQAIAAEAYCDCTHDIECTMKIGDITGISKGNMYVQY